MKNVLAAALILVLSVCAGAAGAAAPSARDFTRAASIEQVSISRDGKHIVALTSPDGVNRTITVWDTDTMDKPPKPPLGSTRMRFLSVRFLKNDRLLVTAIQPITFMGRKRHITKQFVTDLEGKDWKPLLPEGGPRNDYEDLDKRLNGADLIDDLPRDPTHVIVQDSGFTTSGDIFKVNVYTGVAERLERGSERFDGYQTDLNGELRAKQELNYDGGKVYIAQWIKNPANGNWEEHFRSYAKDRQITTIVAFTKDPNVIYIQTTNGGDKAGIFVYDIAQRKIVEPAFQHRMFEATGAIVSRSPADLGQPLGFTYGSANEGVYWVDGKLDATAKALHQALGIVDAPMDWVDPGSGAKARISVAVGADAQIVSMSTDRSLIVVRKGGAKNPGEYYLLRDGGKLTLLGRARPWINAATLGDTRMVQYAARDGLMIPAFLTTPPKDVFGPGPYPTLIEPHGGPWARDEMDWDIAGWVQYFASRGYAVLQPQFRGSEGWGQKLWRAGDGEWGQKMQDDKDDGVKWLIAQGIADPKRVAMFGYSYGGYAALAAAIRPNGLYQCAISGAGAGDLADIERATNDNRFQREFQHPTIKGLDALQHAKEAQIPVFLYHGDHDTTVDPKQSRQFAAALKAAGKPYRLLEIPEMGHQYGTMLPAMMELQLTEIDKFLKTECKPGGL